MAKEDFSDLTSYLDKRFDKLEDTLEQKVDKDELIQVLVTKEEFGEFRSDIRNDISGLRESIHALTVSVDKLTQGVNNLKTEYAGITSKLEKHEKLIAKLANHTGLELED